MDVVARNRNRHDDRNRLPVNISLCMIHVQALPTYRLHLICTTFESVREELAAKMGWDPDGSVDLHEFFCLTGQERHQLVTKGFCQSASKNGDCIHCGTTMKNFAADIAKIVPDSTVHRHQLQALLPPLPSLRFTLVRRKRPISSPVSVKEYQEEEDDTDNWWDAID